MKYKNIYSAIHNFGHSFTSLMNYVDGDYVIDETDQSNLQKSMDMRSVCKVVREGGDCETPSYPD